MKTEKFKFETQGGDASLLNLASQIDRGIKTKIKDKNSEAAKKFRKWHLVLRPLKNIALVTYIMITCVETPSWCSERIDEV